MLTCNSFPTKNHNNNGNRRNGREGRKQSVAEGHKTIREEKNNCRWDRRYDQRLTEKQIEDTILRETIVTREHLTPEIGLHLITPQCRLFHQPVSDQNPKVFPNDPFWGFYWPGGQAITRYILDNPRLFQGKSILDVGSGCGASSLAALRCKAKYVVANDIDEVAGRAVLLNASLNHIPLGKLETCDENLIGQSIEEDIILLGDVFYDEEFAEILIPWLEKLHRDGKKILVGDPGRHGLTEKRLKLMRKMASYELTENCCIENNGFKCVHVWMFN